MIVVADLDPQLAGDHLAEPAQSTGNQRCARYNQPGECDIGARISLGQTTKPCEYSVPLDGRRVLHPARQNHEVVDDGQRLLNVLPTRPFGAYFLHVRGEIIDAEALRDAHHAAPSCRPSQLHRAPSATGIPVSVHTVPDRLWRLEAPACFRRIKFFDLIDEDNDEFWRDRSLGADRKLVYERLLAYGDGGSLRLYLDAAPHRPVARDGRGRVDAHALGGGRRRTLQAPAPAEYDLGRRDEDTRRTTVDVVSHTTS